jgi:DNA uptake protein ComE-like DNA-binding protein
VLALPEKEAAAVIAHRDEHGPFADLAHLKKVPGIDAAVLDAQAEAITFN